MVATGSTRTSSDVTFGPGQDGSAQQLNVSDVGGNAGTLAYSTQAPSNGTTDSSLSMVPNGYPISAFATDLVVTPATPGGGASSESSLLVGIAVGLAVGIASGAGAMIAVDWSRRNSPPRTGRA